MTCIKWVVVAVLAMFVVGGFALSARPAQDVLVQSVSDGEAELVTGGSEDDCETWYYAFQPCGKAKCMGKMKQCPTATRLSPGDGKEGQTSAKNVETYNGPCTMCGAKCSNSPVDASSWDPCKKKK